MDDRFVTLKTFDSPFEAHLAKSRLEEAGLHTFLAGEETVAMDWALSNAIGGITLQVAAEDASRAQALLDVLQETSPANEVESEWTDDDRPSEVPTDKRVSAELEEADDTEPVATDRERKAEQAYRAAVLGILFFPVQLYVFWLLVQVYVSDEELRGRSYTQAWIAAAINAPFVLALCVLLRSMLQS